MLRLRMIAGDGAAPAVVEIVPEFRDPYLELLRLLREAAEIEHALMVQYLYAAFSVRGAYRNKLAGTGFAGSASTITGVAIQEMQHLNAVNQLLAAVGGTPCLIRQDFPYEVAIYPFPFELERLTPASAAKYTWAESPADTLVEGPAGRAPSLLDRLRLALGADLRPNHVGSIYKTMIDLLTKVAADPPPRFPDLAFWVGQLKDIKKEGEDDHFHFFQTVFLGTHPAFPAGLDVWALDPADPRYPSNPVAANPMAFPSGGDDPRAIADESVRRLAWLGDLHYWIILMLLDLSYRYNAQTFSLAVQHMTDGLRVVGFALSELGHGPAFDPLSMGYAPGIDKAGSIELVRRLVQESMAVADDLDADHLLPGNYHKDIGTSTIAGLADL
jgi:hypothetical protein